MNRLVREVSADEILSRRKSDRFRRNLSQIANTNHATVTTINIAENRFANCAAARRIVLSI